MDAGADDYLPKPFSFAELFARLRVLLRRDSGERPVVLRAGDLVLDPATKMVSRGSTVIALSAREFSLLELLLREKVDRPFGRGAVETVPGAGYRLRRDGG